MRTVLTETRDRVVDGVDRRVDRVVPEPVQAFLRWLRSDDFFSTAASLAFYAMISLPPMVLVALWAVGAFVSDETLQSLGRDVQQSSPGRLPVADVLRDLIDLATRVGVVAVLGALWPATAYGAALARAFGQITPDRERRLRGWTGRLLALVVVALMPLAVFAALAVSYLGPRLLPGAGFGLPVAFGVCGLVGVVVLVGVVFSLFRLLSTELGDIVVGAATAGGLMALATGGYLLYLYAFADFQQRYGAGWLATAVLLGLWLLVVNAMLLVGYRIMVRRAQRRNPELTSDGEVGPI